MEHTVVVEGRRVRLLEAGRGQTVLFVHAFPLGADMWRPQLEAVPPGWRFIAPDLRGFGGSEARVAPDERPATSMDAHADDLVALLDHLGTLHAVVVGLSMGGYIAMALVRRAPGRLRALVLADTRAEADSEETREARRTLRATLASGGPAAVAVEMIPRLLGESSRRKQPELEGVVRAIIERQGPAGIDAAIEALVTRPDSTATLAGVTVPTLLLAGDEDVVTPVEVVGGMHEVMAGSVLEFIPGAGHLSNLEQPKAFNAALHLFLAGLSSQPAAHQSRT